MPKPVHINLSLNFIFVLTIISSFAFSSCKKNSPTPITKPISKTGTSVFVAGTVYTSNSIPVAVYWKDGVLHKLVTDSTVSSTANSIAIKDTDVYICGFVKGSAVYWKNGVIITVAPNAEAEAITISGNTIYIAGSIYINKHYVAAYWKNNTLFTIGDTTLMSVPTSIAVNGSDVYVVANEYSTTSSYNYLTLWKNNTKTLISQNTYGTALNSLAINGTDIYITGSLNYYSTTNSSQAALWKNGNLNFYL